MIIIKAGGSAITKKSEDFTPNMEVISTLAQEIKEAQDHLGEITGKVTSDDILGKIFSTFCIGK